MSAQDTRETRPAPRRRTPLHVEHLQPERCTHSLRLQVLHQASFFAMLTVPELEEVQMLFQQRGYDGGQVIFAAGEPARWLYVVASGTVKIVRPTEQGENIVLNLIGAGEFFGSLFTLGDPEYRDTAQAHTPCCVLRIAADDFQDLLRRYPAVTLAALDLVAARLTATRALLEYYRVPSVERRIALVLMKLAANAGEAQSDAVLIEMPLSRQDLAEMAGTTMETASRVMSRLRKAGMIQTGRRWVAIVDRERLAAVAAAQTSLGAT